MSMYTSLPWGTICEEWSKLNVTLREGALVSLQHDKPSALTLRARKRWLVRDQAKVWSPGHSAKPLAQLSRNRASLLLQVW